jgi:hypothetical protein
LKRYARLLFLRERSNVINQIPEVVRFGASALGGHVAFAFLDYVEQLPVGITLQNRWIGEVDHSLEICNLTLAIAVLAMARGAIPTIDLFAFGERLRTRLDGIALVRCFRRDLIFGRWRSWETSGLALYTQQPAKSGVRKPFTKFLSTTTSASGIRPKCHLHLTAVFLDPLTIRTNPGKSARPGRGPSRNKIVHRRFYICRTSFWHSCPNAAGCHRDR